MTPQEELASIAAEASDALNSSTSTAELSAVEVEYLGRKGRLTGLLRLVGTLPADQKPIFGQAVNAEKDKLLSVLETRKKSFLAEERRIKLGADALDVTLPGERLPLGRQHILTRQMDQVKKILIGLGYTFVETRKLSITITTLKR